MPMAMHIYAACNVARYGLPRRLYINALCVWASALLVLRFRAMRRPLKAERATEKFPHAFLVFLQVPRGMGRMENTNLII